MKLSEYRNEAAIELLADILEPATKILADEKIKELINGPRISLIKYVLKNHKSEIIEILAIMDGVPVEEYECNFSNNQVGRRSVHFLDLLRRVSGKT